MAPHTFQAPGPKTLEKSNSTEKSISKKLNRQFLLRHLNQTAAAYAVEDMPWITDHILITPLAHQQPFPHNAKGLAPPLTWCGDYRNIASGATEHIQ